MSYDITFCEGKGCPLRENCHRYLHLLHFRADKDPNRGDIISMFMIEPIKNGTCYAFWEVDKSPEYPQSNPHAHRKCGQCAFYHVWKYPFETWSYHICTHIRNYDNTTGFQHVSPIDQACAYFKIKDSHEHK